MWNWLKNIVNKNSTRKMFLKRYIKKSSQYYLIIKYIN
mgnify:CR=1 FL=1